MIFYIIYLLKNFKFLKIFIWRYTFDYFTNENFTVYFVFFLSIFKFDPNRHKKIHVIIISIFKNSNKNNEKLWIKKLLDVM